MIARCDTVWVEALVLSRIDLRRRRLRFIAFCLISCMGGVELGLVYVVLRWWSRV